MSKCSFHVYSVPSKVNPESQVNIACDVSFNDKDVAWCCLSSLLLNLRLHGFSEDDLQRILYESKYALELGLTPLEVLA